MTTTARLTFAAIAVPFALWLVRPMARAVAAEVRAWWRRHHRRRAARRANRANRHAWRAIEDRRANAFAPYNPPPRGDFHLWQ